MIEMDDVRRMDGKEAEASMLPSGGRPSQRAEGSKTTQYLVTLAATMAAFSGGSVVGWNAPASHYLQSENSTLPITQDQASWIGSLVTVGAFFGALPAGPIADTFGRKLTILGLAVPLLISWVMIFFASSVYLIYLARLTAGLAIGATCTTVPMYVSEIAEASIRGILGSSFQFMIVSGILYGYVFGAFASYEVLTICCAITPILFILAFIKAPESPIYLLKKKQKQKAESALLVLRGKNYNVYKEIQALESELNQNSGGRNVSITKALCKRASILSLTICFGLMIFQQLSGVNIVIFYSNSIFADAGSTLDPALATILVGLAQVVAVVITAVLIDRLGRKILLQASAAIMAICLFVLGWYFYVKEKGDDTSSISLVPVVSVVLYMLVFGVGYGPIPWMMAGEILPPEIKGLGTSIAVALNWCLAFTVTKSFHLLQGALGSAMTYWLFGCICFVAFIFSIFTVIETKGKTLAEIQTELSGKRTKEQRSNVI